MSDFSEIVKNAISRAGVMHVRSALNPFLWACALVCPLAWFAAFEFRSDEMICHVLVFTGVLPIALVGIVGLIFAISDPSKLQSEEYQIKHQTLNLIERKGGKFVLNPDALVEIANPVVVASGDGDSRNA